MSVSIGGVYKKQDGERCDGYAIVGSDLLMPASIWWWFTRLVQQ